MGRPLWGEVELRVRKGLQMFTRHVAGDDLAHDVEALVVHFPQHPVLQPALCCQYAGGYGEGGAVTMGKSSGCAGLPHPVIALTSAGVNPLSVFW